MENITEKMRTTRRKIGTLSVEAVAGATTAAVDYARIIRSVE
jgi:hypothetical protein